MKAKDMKKIERLTRFGAPGTKGGKPHLYGPYWWGCWQEDGQTKRVFIGKELPAELQWLLDGRIKRPGRRRWIWPAAPPEQELQTPSPVKDEPTPAASVKEGG